MTKKELGQMGHLKREIEQDKQRLRELEAVAMGTANRISGLPALKGGISDKTALGAEIALLRQAVDGKLVRCVKQYTEMYRYIEGVDDVLMREILALRHINGLSWRQVAFHVGGGNTEDTVRQAYHRWMKKEEAQGA